MRVSHKILRRTDSTRENRTGPSSLAQAHRTKPLGARTAHRHMLSHMSLSAHARRTKPSWVQTHVHELRSALYKALVSSHRKDVQHLHTLPHRSTKPLWARTEQMYRISYMSSSAHAPARAQKKIVQRPGGRAPAHSIKPLWICTAQSPCGLEPYRCTESRT